MAARDYTLTLTGVAQRLSSVLSDTTPGGTRDEACRQIIVAQDPTNTHAIYFGSTASVTSSAYGFSLDPTEATAKDREIIGPFDTGPVKLSEIWVIGTANDKLHLFVVPF